MAYTISIGQFEQSIPAFCEFVTAKGSPKTGVAYACDLRQYAQYVRSLPVLVDGALSTSLARQYFSFLREAKNEDSTIIRKLAALSSYCDFLRAETVPSLPNPFLRLPLKRSLRANKEPKPVDTLLLELILSGIDNLRDQALFRLLLATGLRISEVHALNRDSISIHEERNGDVRVITGSGEIVGKGNKRRRFFVDEATLIAYAGYVTSRSDASAALFVSARGTRLSVRGIQYRLAHWCEKFGAPHINVHRLRHTFATVLANNDIDSVALRHLMGHASFTTTMQYFKLHDKTIRRQYHAAMGRAKRRNPST